LSFAISALQAESAHPCFLHTAQTRLMRPAPKFSGSAGHRPAPFGQDDAGARRACWPRLLPDGGPVARQRLAADSQGCHATHTHGLTIDEVQRLLDLLSLPLAFNP
jgi:hypothetical protein